jgi:hypothetical protein
MGIENSTNKRIKEAKEFLTQNMLVVVISIISAVVAPLVLIPWALFYPYHLDTPTLVSLQKFL